MSENIKKIGILGGSFDPVHVGHLMMAESAADAFDLERVIFVVAAHSPFKGKEAVASTHRLAMVKRAVKSNKRLAVSDIELKRGGDSYTFETLQHFKQIYPGAEFYLIIGEDNVAGLPRWKNIDAIYHMAKIIVIERDWFDVSSTLIRNRLKQKKSVRYIMTDGVMKYIKKNHLYG